MASENISRTRSRIVQSPERIKRNISTMGTAAAEDKRTVASNEAKTRELQAKIAALLNIEKARLRMCESGKFAHTGYTASRTFVRASNSYRQSRKR